MLLVFFGLLALVAHILYHFIKVIAGLYHSHQPTPLPSPTLMALHRQPTMVKEYIVQTFITYRPHTTVNKA